jgi:hypothetical protein
VAVVLLPLTPRSIFVAVRRDTLRIEAHEYLDSDASWLNYSTAFSSHRHVFSQADFDEQQKEVLTKIFRRRPPGEEGNAYRNSEIAVRTPRVVRLPLSFLEVI